MTTQAGDFSELAMKPEVSFESSGLSPEEAERLAASFKPSWEFDDAPFTQATGLPQSDLEELEAGGVNSDVRRNMRVRDSERSQAVSAHAVPQRVQTNEPEVSVIIDRSITAPSEEPPRPPPPSARPPAPVPSPFAAQMAAAALAPNRIVAPVARSRMNADESLELPASLKKSNKGLFIGVGAAAAAAVLVFAVRAATGSSDTPPPTPAVATAQASDTSRAATANIPPVRAAPAATTAPPPRAGRCSRAAPPSPPPQLQPPRRRATPPRRSRCRSPRRTPLRPPPRPSITRHRDSRRRRRRAVVSSATIRSDQARAPRVVWRTNRS